MSRKLASYSPWVRSWARRISANTLALFGAGVLMFLLVALLPLRAVAQPNPSLKEVHLVDTDPYWVMAHEAVQKGLLEQLANPPAEPNPLPLVLLHGDPNAKYLALTFDDGPHPAFTPRLLALLRQLNLKVTFFVVGEMAERYPTLVLDEVADGHLVGNHTYHHRSLKLLSPEDAAIEVKACNDVLRDITGSYPHLFRPPGGGYTRKVTDIVHLLGCTTVLWTDDPGDYARPPEKVLKARLYHKITNGGIILLHDGIEETLALLPDFVADMRARGYQFVTIDELMKKHADEKATPDKS